MIKSEYKTYVDHMSRNSPLAKNMLIAFAVGGAICALGQALTNVYKWFGMDKLESAAACSITLVFLGAFFTGLKLYDKLAKYAGAGTLVPITGFSNAVVSPAMEFKSEGFIMGVGAKMFAVAGPVIVFGVISSVLYGLVLYVFKIVV